MNETYTTVKIGNRLYKVKLHFNDRAKESFEDKVLRDLATRLRSSFKHSQYIPEDHL